MLMIVLINSFSASPVVKYGSRKSIKSGVVVISWHGFKVSGACVCPHRWADCCVQVQLRSITLHSLSARAQAVSPGGCPPPLPQRQPIRAREQWDGRAPLLSAGLMPIKVQRCRHSVAQGRARRVCVEVSTKLLKVSSLAGENQSHLYSPLILHWSFYYVSCGVVDVYGVSLGCFLLQFSWLDAFKIWLGLSWEPIKPHKIIIKLCYWWLLEHFSGITWQ